MADITSTLFLAIRARNEVDAGLNAAGASLRSFAAGTAGLGVAGLAIGAGVAGAAVVKMAGDYQQSMLKVQTMTGTAASQMPQLTKGVLDMAKQVPFSAQSLAESMYFISSSGFKGADAMHILHESAMEAANGGLKDASGVADVLTTALASYGLHADQAGRMTGILQNAVQLGKAEMDDFARSLSTVLPAAATSGVQFEQVANAMALLTLHGETAQKSAQGLNRILAETIKPTAGEQDAARRMGLTDVFTAQNLSKVGVPEFMSEIAAKVPKGPEGQTLLAQLFGDKNALRDARIMMSDLDTLHTNMATFNGDVMTGKNVSDGFATTMKGFNQSFEQAKDSIGSSATALGLQLLPAMTSLMNTLGPSVAGGIDALSTGLGGLMAMAGQASGTLAPLRTALTGAFSGLGTFLKTTVEPAVFSALGTMLTWWQQHGAEVARMLSGLGNDVLKFAGWVGSNFGWMMNTVGSIAEVGWAAVTGVFALGEGILSGNTKKNANLIEESYRLAFHGIIGAAGGLTEGMARIIGDGLVPTINKLTSFLNSPQGIQGAMVGLLEQFMIAADNTQNAIAGALNKLIDLANKVPGVSLAHFSMVNVAKDVQDHHKALMGLFSSGAAATTGITTKPTDQAVKDIRTFTQAQIDAYDAQNKVTTGLQKNTPAYATYKPAEQVGRDAIDALLKQIALLSKNQLKLTGPTTTGLGSGPAAGGQGGAGDDGTGGGGAGGLGDSKATLRQAVRDARAVFQTDLLTKGVGQEQLLGDVGGIKTAMVAAMQQAGLFTQPQIAKEVGSDLHRVTTMFAHLDMTKLNAEITLSRDHLQDLLKQGDKASADRERQHFITLDTQKYLAQGLPADLAKQLAAAEGAKIGQGGLTITGGLGGRGVPAALRALLQSERDPSLSYGTSTASFLTSGGRGGDLQAQVANLTRQLANADKLLAAANETNRLLRENAAATQKGATHQETTATHTKMLAEQVTRHQPSFPQQMAALGARS